MIAELITGIVVFLGGTFYSKQTEAKKFKQSFDETASSYKSTIENLKRKSKEDEQRIQDLTEELHSLRKRYNSSDSNLIDLEEDNQSLKKQIKKLQNELDRLNALCTEYQKACEAKDFEISTLRGK